MIVVFASLRDKGKHKGTVYTSCVSFLGQYENLDLFTPSKRLVYGWKCGQGDIRFKAYPPLTSDDYVKGYASLLKSRSQEVRTFIDSIQEDITICCFCKEGAFCHRRLLAKWFKSYRPELDVRLY